MRRIAVDQINPLLHNLEAIRAVGQRTRWGAPPQMIIGSAGKPAHLPGAVFTDDERGVDLKVDPSQARSLGKHGPDLVMGPGDGLI